jgi:hypothetical protein
MGNFSAFGIQGISLGTESNDGIVGFGRCHEIIGHPGIATEKTYQNTAGKGIKGSCMTGFDLGPKFSGCLSEQGVGSEPGRLVDYGKSFQASTRALDHEKRPFIFSPISNPCFIPVSG